jgi:PPE-repeat protein
MPTSIITPKPTPVGFTAKTQYAQSYSESSLIADFGSIPPETNSARMYAGPGPDSLLTAAAMWDALAADLYEAAGSHQAIASQVTESWLGPASMAMTSATTPYLAWLHDTAAIAARTAQHARAAVAAYEAARAMTVPPWVVAANRAQLATMVAANALGLDTHAISATEARYREMWAQDSTAMYMYADTSANASHVTPFLPPPGIVGEANVPRLRGRPTSSTIVDALRRLASPARITVDSVGGRAQMGASATNALMSARALAKPVGWTAPSASPALAPATGIASRIAVTAVAGKAAAVGALSAPRSWLTAGSVSGSAAPAPGGWSTAPITTTPAVPMMPVTSTPGRGVDSYVAASSPGPRTIVRMRSSN